MRFLLSDPICELRSNWFHFIFLHGDNYCASCGIPSNYLTLNQLLRSDWDMPLRIFPFLARDYSRCWGNFPTALYLERRPAGFGPRTRSHRFCPMFCFRWVPQQKVRTVPLRLAATVREPGKTASVSRHRHGWRAVNFSRRRNLVAMEYPADFTGCCDLVANLGIETRGLHFV